MLNRLHRFHGLGSLRSVYQRGQTVRGPLISLKYSKGNPDKPYRATVVVSKKVHKSAVVRNRIRRRVYECVRKSKSGIPAGDSLVFTVFSEQVAELPSAQLQKNIDNLLEKAAGV